MTPEEGFETPIHRSLTEPIMLAGLPRAFAILLWTPGMIIVLGLYQIWFLIVMVGLHGFFAALAKRDPYFFTVFCRSIRDRHRYVP